MPIANNNYDVLGGFEVTQSQTTAANDTVTVSTGVYRNRVIGSTTYADSAYVSVLGASVTGTGSSGTPLALAATGYKRIDLVVFDTSSATFKVITGTAVAASGTAVIPNITATTQFPLATIAVSDSAISKRTDVRDTADYLPVRAFNRSQAVRIGKQTVRTNNNTYVDLNDPVSAKELSYHSAIGAVYVTGAITSSNNDLQVNSGLKTAITGTGTGTYTVAAGEIRNADNQVLYTIAGSTATTNAAPATATKMRNDLVFVDISDPNTPTYGVKTGDEVVSTTGAAGVKYSQLTKDQIPVAVILVPVTTFANAKFVDVRPAF
jgi:hypothetical protein